ncbi:MAG: LytTR family DNA-binding domain-containing protein [Chitinophagaceae bacterium]
MPEQKIQIAVTILPALLIRVDRHWLKVFYSDIILLEASNQYVKIFTTASPHAIMMKGMIGQVEQQLPANYFCRVHRSYIVGVQHIKYVCHDLINMGSKEVPLSKGYVPQLNSRFIMLT